jgi:hypothetical protein
MKTIRKELNQSLFEMTQILNDPTISNKIKRALIHVKFDLPYEEIYKLCPKDYSDEQDS